MSLAASPPTHPGTHSLPLPPLDRESLYSGTPHTQTAGAGPVFLLAATLRPETMYGQTNAWALPEGDYVAVRCALPL